MYVQAYGPGKGFCREPDQRNEGLTKNHQQKGQKKYNSISPNKQNGVTENQASVNLLTTNAAGLRYKDSDLKNKLQYFNSTIFTIQETHFAKKGKFIMDKFVIFESIRKCKQKGGSILGAHKDLNPVLVSEYSDEFELLVVEVNTGNTKIRIFTGYGPQESWEDSHRLPFFEALKKEID